MSHNVVLNHVKITDLGLLANVVKSLSQGQATLNLDQKTFRTFQGQSNVCDHCIAMPGPHDIGMQKTKDKDGYNLIYDPYRLDPVFANSSDGNRVGKLLVEYGLQEAEYQASQMGMLTTRTKSEDGSVILDCVYA